MASQKFPVGIQSFPWIIRNGYTYVDKTRYIPMLLNKGKAIFLSRPRRFGKSLLLSTLESFFEGRRELFKGLAIDRMDMDWTPSPVLHFDFNNGIYTIPDGLLTRLHHSLEKYEKEYGVPVGNARQEEMPIRFERLIHEVYLKTGREVVILIDEYDKPMLAIEENREIFESNQILLKGFFSNLKTMDSYIRFAFITGVARFSKVSIFSDLNHLDDISLTDAYADICGLTEEELVGSFRNGIEELAQKRGESFNQLIGVLRSYYDGYLFAPEGSRLYNPFSVLKALSDKDIAPYWFDSATPTFLVQRIRNKGVDPRDINQRKCTKSQLMQVGMESYDPVPLMFQTGYLTIDSYDSIRQRFTLRFPNREVEIGFADQLLPLYMKGVNESDSPFSLFSFQDDLYDGHPSYFMERLSTFFKDLPGEDHQESTYRAVTYLLCKLCSLDSRAEQRSYKGRSDMEVFTTDYIYIFEFKYNRSVKEAMEQIQNRDYAGRYALDHRKIFLIAANLRNKEGDRKLEYKIID